MTPLKNIPYKKLKVYLENEQYIYSYMVQIRESSLIYSFRRYYASKPKTKLKVKVDRKTKNVVSVKIGDDIYTDLDVLKPVIDYKIIQSKNSNNHKNKNRNNTGKK